VNQLAATGWHYVLFEARRKQIKQSWSVPAMADFCNHHTDVICCQALAEPCELLRNAAAAAAEPLGVLQSNDMSSVDQEHSVTSFVDHE
jgi:hypothetical protein